VTTNVLEKMIHDKNRLMLDLQQAKDVGEAAEKVRELAHDAAELENQIAGVLMDTNQVASAIPNLISAASCYAVAGEAGNAERVLWEGLARIPRPSVRDDEIDRARELVELLLMKKGNRTAFTAVMRRNLALVKHFAASILGQHSADLDDVVQDAFCKLWQARRKIQYPNRLRGWLAATVKNTAISRWRTLCRQARKLVDLHVLARRKTVTAMNKGSAWQSQEVDEILDMIPDESDRAVVIDYYWCGKSDAEIAEELGISPDAAKHRRGRTIEKLREKLR